MRWYLVLAWLAAAAAAAAAQGTLLALPELELCRDRPKHWRHGNHNYFFSGDYDHRDFTFANGTAKKVNWLEARNFCRQRCMDAVSMEGKEENDMVFEFIQSRNLTYIWTSGRLCDFDGCEARDDLKPINVKGWFWSGTNTKMAPTNSTPPGWPYQPWSPTGHKSPRHTGGPQPDNAEFIINNTPESCMGVLNNIYQDGVKWHDIACYHKKPFICEDTDNLLAFVKASAKDANGNPAPITDPNF